MKQLSKILNYFLMGYNLIMVILIFFIWYKIFLFSHFLKYFLNFVIYHHIFLPNFGFCLDIMYKNL